MRSIITIISIVLIVILAPIKFRMDVPVTFKMFWVNYNVSKTRVPIINSKVVNVSAYNNTVEQCDEDPYVMAWNHKITKENRNSIVAVSRDLEKIGLTKNINIAFQIDGKVYSKTILDKMGLYARKGGRRCYKIKNSIDILMEKCQDAKNFGRKNIKIYWFAGQTELFEFKREVNCLIYEGNVNNIFNNKNIKILETSKLGYTKIKTFDGQILYISSKAPMNPSMYTDFYQFTKMMMYLEAGKQDEYSVFNLFYRNNPYNGGFTISMGVQDVVDYLKKLEITGNDIDYLRSNWTFSDKFWEYLRDGFRWDDKCILEALPDGTMAQPHVPLIQVKAPLPIADFIETRLLNIVGGQIMVTTKAARMTIANPEVPWWEMAARRAQSMETGLMISKCAFCAGSAGTSNTLAGQLFGIPVSGTTSHSSVLAFEEQIDSFETCADLFGKKSIFIIDTFGYIRGAMDAIKTAKKKGLETFGVRDDGDTEELAFHTKVVREILKANGFGNAKIITSNDIDEFIRSEMKDEGAENDADGIGTMLVPGPIGVVYKPVQIGDRIVIKLSYPAKITDPCSKRVFRTYNSNGLIDTYIATLENEEIIKGMLTYHRSNGCNEKKQFSEIDNCDEILVTMLHGEDEVFQQYLDLNMIREKIKSEINIMCPELKQFRNENPIQFPLWLSQKIWDAKQTLMEKYQIVKEG